MNDTRPAATSYDAVIVGAGLAGSSMAAGLAGQGWQVLVVERDSFPRHKVCGEFLSPEAQHTLAAFGLDETIASLAPRPLHAAQLTTARGATLTMPLPGEAWGISRFAMDAALAAAAAQCGAEVLTGTTVSGWQHNEQGMTVQFRPRQDSPQAEAQTTVQARAIIMACGRHAPATLVPSHTRPDAQQAGVGIKSHFINLAMPAQVELYLFAGGYVGINPVEDGSVNVCALASYETFARAGRSPSALIEAAMQWNPAFAARMAGAEAVPETECSVAPVDTRRTPQVWDQVPLLGDTAAMIAPLCGDGMAMALRSAELCAPLIHTYLVGEATWQEVGQRYQRAWQREFADRLRLGRWLETLLLEPRHADLLLRVGKVMPSLARYLLHATRGSAATLPPQVAQLDSLSHR